MVGVNWIGDIDLADNFLGAIIIYASAVLIWFGGEAGRAYVAGAAGGLMRWWMADRRRLKDGIPSAVTGAIFARYLSPIVLSGMDKVFGQLGDGAQDAATFATGLMGMSMAKIVLAALEKRAADFGGRNE